MAKNKAKRPRRRCTMCGRVFEQKNSRHYKCPDCGAHFTEVIDE